MNGRPPIRINLDAIGALLDRALAHPAAALVRMAAPEFHGAIVEARNDLVGVAAHAMGKVHDAAIGHLDKRAADVVRKATGKKKKQPKRLKR